MANRRGDFYDMTNEELQNICDSSKSMAQAMKKANTTSPNFKRILMEKGIDLTKLNTNKKYKKNLSGMKFGRLTVIKIDEDRNKKGTWSYWLCKCDCGNPQLISVKSSSLTTGKTKSCGCLRKENLGRIATQNNKYDLSNEYGIGYTANNNHKFYFDKEDYDKIKDFTWRIIPTGYITSNDKNQKTVYLHRLIMSCDEGLEVDHINLDKSDNRKNNLRICTRGENARNRKKLKNNTSGCTGVLWEKRFKCWRARIVVDHRDIHLGLFDDFEEAVKARKEAETKYFKEFKYEESGQENDKSR